MMPQAPRRRTRGPAHPLATRPGSRDRKRHLALSAGPGSDVVTGRGSPIVNLLVHDLAEAPNTSTTSTGTLADGQSIRSPNGLHTLTMRTDGDLVVYSADGGILWMSNTGNHLGAYLSLNNSGKLQVLFNGTVLWSN